MTIKQPFMPEYGANQVVAVAAVSAAVTINRASKQVRITNTGAAKGYFRTYNGSNGAQSATVADCCVPAGMSTTVTKPTGTDGHDKIATISAATTTFEVITGEGF